MFIHPIHAPARPNSQNHPPTHPSTHLSIYSITHPSKPQSFSPTYSFLKIISQFSSQLTEFLRTAITTTTTISTMTVKHDVGSAKRSPEHLQDGPPPPKRAKTEEAATTSEVATQTTDPEPASAPAPAMVSSATQTEPVAIIPVQHLSMSAVFINADIEACDPPSPPPSPPVLPILPPAPTEPDWLVLYEMELEAIRMAKPFVTGKGAIVVKTNLRRKPVAAKRPQTNRVVRTTTKSAPASRKSSSTAPAPARKTSAPASLHDVISVDSDDDKPTAKRLIPVGGAGEYSNNDDHVYQGRNHGSYADREYQVSREGSYDSLFNSPPQDDHHELQQLIEQGLEECPEEEPKFYGVSDRTAATSTRSLLRFQDRFSHVGRYPSPEFGHRLIFGSFLYESKNKIPGNVEQAIEQSLNDATGEKVTMNEDTSIAKEWCPTRKTMNEDAISKGLGPSSEPDSYYLMKGFPLVEKVEFLVNKNSASPQETATGEPFHSVSMVLLTTGIVSRPITSTMSTTSCRINTTIATTCTWN